MINQFFWFTRQTPWLFAVFLLFSCSPLPESATIPTPVIPTAEVKIVEPQTGPTPLPTRTAFPPGELVDYAAQTGDTLPALAAHFNTTIAEILAANEMILRISQRFLQACP